MAIELIKVDLTDNLGSPRNISQNRTTRYAACMENRTSNERYFLHIKTEKLSIIF